MRVAPRQVLGLLRLPCSVTAGLIQAGRLERPTFRMSRGCSAVELRRDWLQDMDLNHNYLIQSQVFYR
jgi:hypothetical protein